MVDVLQCTMTEMRSKAVEGPGDAIPPARHQTAVRRDHGGHGDRMSAELERFWTQRQAAEFLHVSTRWLRASSCPKVLLPGHGEKSKPMLRYEPTAVRTWALSFSNGRAA
jgi:hypothetical protein